jgi:hypothetical protein
VTLYQTELRSHQNLLWSSVWDIPKIANPRPTARPKIERSLAKKSGESLSLRLGFVERLARRSPKGGPVFAKATVGEECAREESNLHVLLKPVKCIFLRKFDIRERH